MGQHEIQVILRDGMHFEGRTDDPDAEHFPLHFDTDPEAGGQGEGIRPAKMVLMGLAGCMGMDVISILRKKQQQVSGLEVKVTADRADEHPKVYTHIRVKFVITGNQIDPAAVARAIDLSYTKYCPVANLLKPLVPIDTEYEIVSG